MRRLLLLFFAALATLVAVTPASGAPRPLADVVGGLVKRSPVGAATSVVVRDGNGTVIAAVRPGVPRLPASNQKILTIATALDELGRSTRLQTRLVAAAPPTGGVVDGDVWLIGGGDPTFSTPAFGASAYGIFVATPDRLAERLRAAGVTRINGRLLADASHFDAVSVAPGWKPSFIPLQSPPLTALTIDRAATSPSLRAARAVRNALRRAGIEVGRAAVAKRAAPPGVELALVESAPVEVLAELAGRNSDNFVAEMLLKAAALQATGTGTTKSGVALQRALLGDLDVPLAGLVLADGSGLSYDNRATASALSLLLSRVDDDPRLGPDVRDALARAGVNGTLASRMLRGPARGVVEAKTGTLNDASGLSGYAGACTFSVLTQRVSVDQAAAHALQDAIAQVVAKRRGAC